LTRALLAWVPVRGTWWSGAGGGCVTHWLIDGSPLSALSVRTRVALDEEKWLPGDPEGAAPALTARVPTIDDGVVIKDFADVWVRETPLLRSHALTARIGDASLPGSLPAAAEWAAITSLRDRRAVRLRDEIASYQLAPPSWRCDLIEEGALVGWDIDGVAARRGTIDFAVGAVAHAQDGAARVIEMVCDSILLDVERGEADLVWRGIFLDPTWGEGLTRLVVGVLPRGVAEEDRLRLLEEGLARAVFTQAANADDIEAERPPPPLREEDLAMARLTTWEEGPGAPTLSAEEFALISSELAAGPRADVLSRYGFDEIAWGLEEWAQGERTANESADLPDDIADEEGGAGAHERGAPAVAPARAARDIDIEGYARLVAHLAVRDPARVLAEVKLSVNELIAIEEAMGDALEKDRALAAELDRLVPTFGDEVMRAHEGDLARFGLKVDEVSGTREGGEAGEGNTADEANGAGGSEP
jgi:hypothetical protein